MADTTTQIIIEMHTGRRWVIHGPGAHPNLRLMEGSLGEFYRTPKATTYKERSGIGGALFMGSRDLPMRFSLKIDTWGDDFDTVMADFLRGMSSEEGQEATLIHRTEKWGERRLRILMEEGAAYRRNVDPESLASASYELPVIAPVPYWTAPSMAHDEWVFEGTGFVGEVEVSNPGDVPLWPRWTLTSPAAWILPDVDLRSDGEPRMVPLRFAPYGRDLLVQTHPGEELIVATDGTLDAWMGDGPVHFLHPIPPHTPPTRIPVAVDPIPGLPWHLPMEWKQWIAQRLHQFLMDIGVDAFMQKTPDELGAEIAGWIRGATPDWVPTIGDGLLAELTGQVFADAIREHYGTWGNVRGVTAQVELEYRWEAPWG